jgi:hypothetical protein
MSLTWLAFPVCDVVWRRLVFDLEKYLWIDDEWTASVFADLVLVFETKGLTAAHVRILYNAIYARIVCVITIIGFDGLGEFKSEVAMLLASPAVGLQLDLAKQFLDWGEVHGGDSVLLAQSRAVKQPYHTARPMSTFIWASWAT